MKIEIRLGGLILRRIVLAAAACAAIAPSLAQEPAPSPTPTPEGTPAPSPTPEATPAPTPTPPPPTQEELFQGLKDEEVSRALDSIQKQFLDKNRTSDAAQRRAALAGYLDGLSPGVRLAPSESGGGAEPFPFLAEILDSHTGYVRVGSIEGGTLAQLDAALASFRGKDVTAVVLDLRGAPASSDYEKAAEFARRFCAKGKVLFTLQNPSAKQERIFTSNQDPAFSGVLVVLVDADTAGAAEALAGALRVSNGAMIIGGDTTGEAVEFVKVPMGNAVLQVAVSQVILPEAGSIFPEGVKPDIVVTLPREVRDRIFRESKDKGVLQFVVENERTRMNEASLVANTNPEVDIAQSVQRDRGKTPPPRDTVLQRALDLVTAINFYKSRGE